MRTHKTLLIVAMAVGLMCLTAIQSQCVAAEKQEAAKTIRVDDLVYAESAHKKDKTVVIGRLDHPLREVVSVKGVWVDPGPDVKDSSLRFQVTEVNGKELTKPVVFYGYSVGVVTKQNKNINPSTAGEKWELWAYEAWTNYDHPQKYLDELGVPPASPPQRNQTQLIGVLKLAIK
jgi:hypothetical protein